MKLPRKLNYLLAKYQPEDIITALSFLKETSEVLDRLLRFPVSQHEATNTELREMLETRKEAKVLLDRFENWE